jgi:hypothetical protein
MWKTSDIKHIAIKDSRNLYMEVGGFPPIMIHFYMGSNDSAKAIATKLEASKELSMTLMNGDPNVWSSVAPVIPDSPTKLSNYYNRLDVEVRHHNPS